MVSCDTMNINKRQLFFFCDGFNNGFNNGIDTAKKDAAIAFAELHVPVEQIASALQVNVEIAKQWIGNK